MSDKEKIEQLADSLTRYRAHVITSDDQDREVIEDAKKEIKEFMSDDYKDKLQQLSEHSIDVFDKQGNRFYAVSLDDINDILNEDKF